MTQNFPPPPLNNDRKLLNVFEKKKDPFCPILYNNRRTEEEEEEEDLVFKSTRPIPRGERDLKEKKEREIWRSKKRRLKDLFLPEQIEF